jgi:predicted ATPase
VASVESAVRFCIEAAKAYGAGACRWYDAQEFDRLVELYGPMRRLQGADERK